MSTQKFVVTIHRNDGEFMHYIREGGSSVEHGAEAQFKHGPGRVRVIPMPSKPRTVPYTAADLDPRQPARSQALADAINATMQHGAMAGADPLTESVCEQQVRAWPLPADAPVNPVRPLRPLMQSRLSAVPVNPLPTKVKPGPWARIKAAIRGWALRRGWVL